MKNKILSLFILIMVFTMNTVAFAKLPEGFVYLEEIDPSIIVSMRYLTEQNFIGEPLRGYKKPVVILTKQAAVALSKVQKEVVKDGFSLVIYDAYRPQKTVNQFVEWSEDWHDNKMKTIYYPRVDKKELFVLQYVSEKSSHTRGSTVDISMIPVGMAVKKTEDIVEERRTLADGFGVIFLDDNTVDMGTSFDLFDEASHPGSKLVGEQYLKNRKYLQENMEKQGFSSHHSEWWHFTLEDEPFPDTYFDFDVE